MGTPAYNNVWFDGNGVRHEGSYGGGGTYTTGLDGTRYEGGIGMNPASPTTGWDGYDPGHSVGAGRSGSSGGSGSGTRGSSAGRASADLSNLSGAEAEALAQFRAAHGRDPNSAEISAYRSWNSGAASSAAAASASPTDVMSDVDMGELADNLGTEWQPATTPAELARIDAASRSAADSSLGAAEDLVAQLRQANESWLRGEISGDAADQVRSQAALSARAGGVGVSSQAARNLQARDFGTTSMQIQQQGIAQGGQINQLQQGISGLRENRMRFLEEQHQFSSEYRRAAAAAEEQSRQFGAGLVDQMYRSQLAHRELMLKQEAFNAEQNMRIVELIAQTTAGLGQLQVQAAVGGVDDDSGITSMFDNLQQQLQRLIQGNQQQ